MKRIRSMTMGSCALALAALGLTACADTPPPTAQLGASSQAIAAAERAGALQHAPVELQSARDKLAAAEAAARDDDNTRARRLAEQSQVDAELAATRSHLAVTQEAASTVRTAPLAGSTTGSTTAPLTAPVAGSGTGSSLPLTAPPSYGAPAISAPAGSTSWGTTSQGVRP